MSNSRMACSASVLLLFGMACLMASLHHSELLAPFAAAAHSALFGMLVPATPRLRKLQTESVMTDMQAAQGRVNQAASGDQQIEAVQPPGSVLIVDDNSVQQARCDSFICPVNSTLREMPETIPCLLEICTNGDTATCCDGDWPDPENIRRIEPLTTPTPKTYLPVFLMHGLGTGVEVFAELTMMIEQQHPGTIVHAIPLFQGKESFKSLQTQVETISGYVRAVVLQDPETYSQGYNMVCYSQGGLICRAVIEYMDDHNVHTFISLAAPHMGVYGAEFFKAIIKEPFWQKWTLDNVWMVAQSWILQATLSIANMWHDPFHPSSDIKHFLPKYNGLANDPYGNAQRKANFVRLQKAVFLSGRIPGSHWDGGIEPSRTGVFEYYKEGSVTEFTPMTEQPIYVYDTFGLKTLDTQGKLEVHNPVGVWHGDWVANPPIILQYIIPHLQ